METLKTDVAIVGGSIAGCAAAVMLARQGLKVEIIERQASVAAYKRVCTHFIQAGATPVFERLGLIDRLEAAGAVRNGMQLWTRWGWSRLSPERKQDANGRRLHGYNLRREKLDPLFRELALETEGVSLRMGHSARELLKDEAGVVRGLEVEGPGGVRTRIEARLVVGADGRNSRVVQLANIETEVLPHNRGGYIAYYRGLKLATGSDAQFWLLDPDIGYAFPNEDGITCLAMFVTKDKLPEFKKDIEGNFLKFFDALPDGPNPRLGERISDFVGMIDIPNLYRHPEQPGLALVGDAALATDPVWGMGCGWALLSAELLADAVGPALVNGGELGKALKTYAKRHKAKLYGQHRQNAGYSTGGPLDPVRRLLFSTLPVDARARELMHDVFTERVDPRLGGLKLLARAAWFQATRWARSTGARATHPTFVAQEV